MWGKRPPRYQKAIKRCFFVSLRLWRKQLGLSVVVAELQEQTALVSWFYTHPVCHLTSGRGARFHALGITCYNYLRGSTKAGLCDYVGLSVTLSACSLTQRVMHGFTHIIFHDFFCLFPLYLTTPCGKRLRAFSRCFLYNWARILRSPRICRTAPSSGQWRRIPPPGATETSSWFWRRIYKYPRLNNRYSLT